MYKKWAEIADDYIKKDRDFPNICGNSSISHNPKASEVREASEASEVREASKVPNVPNPLHSEPVSGQQKERAVEMTEMGCNNIDNRDECNDRPKCQYDEDLEMCEKKIDIFIRKREMLKSSINSRLAIPESDPMFVNMELIMNLFKNYSENDWNNYKKESELERKKMILEYLENEKKIKQLIAESEGKSATITDVEKNINTVKENIRGLEQKSQGDIVLGRETHGIDTPEAKKAADAGPDPVGRDTTGLETTRLETRTPDTTEVDSGDVGLQLENEEVLSREVGVDTLVTDAYPEPESIIDNLEATETPQEEEYVNNLLEIIKKLEIGQQ